MEAQEKSSKNEQFVERLRNSIEDSGKSKSQIAREVGIKPPYLSQLLTGKPGLKNYDLKVKLANATGVSLKWLLTGEEPKYENIKKISSLSKEEEEKLVKTYETFVSGILKILPTLTKSQLLELSSTFLEEGNIESAQYVIDELKKREEQNSDNKK